MADSLSQSTIATLADRLGATLGARLRRGEPLGQYTTFRIGGPADAFVQVETADELAEAILTARALGVPYFVLGLGANILVGDLGFRGLVIRNAAAHHRFVPDPTDDGVMRLWAESGTVMQDLILAAVEEGWSGLEHFIGIPSTVGGAIWQNLHFLSPAPERERTMFIAECFESCEILSAEGERRTVGADYVQFGYDDTVFHHRADFVLAATFRLVRGDPERLHRILHENLSWRGARHPWLQVHPSAGSIFKKIEGVGAGRLIDQAGFKGHRHGRAQISPLHANIIVNNGGATAREVRELIALAQGAVAEKFGQRLETEIGMIGEFAKGMGLGMLGSRGSRGSGGSLVPRGQGIRRIHEIPEIPAWRAPVPPTERRIYLPRMSLRRLLALVLSLALVVAAVRPVDARCATSAGAMSGMAMEHGRSHHAPPVGHGAAPTDCAASLHCASAAPTIAAPIVAVVAVGIDEARATGALLAATDAPIEPEFPPPRG